MTYIADIKWVCKCGAENTDQLWTTEADHCCEDYENGLVPNDCDINWSDPCKECGNYELSDAPVDEMAVKKRWDVVPVE